MAHKKTLMKNDEAQQLQRLLHKDEKAFRVFYMETKDSLLRYIAKYLPEDEAEEVLQDTYLAFIESLRNFRGEAKLRTYLYVIAKRKAVDKLRRKKVKQVLFSYLPVHFVESVAKVFIKDEIDKRLLIKKIEKVLVNLPPDYAQVIKLKYKDDFSIAEIAEKKEMTSKAVESMLFRARKAFTIIYKRYDRQKIHSIEEAI